MKLRLLAATITHDIMQGSSLLEMLDAQLLQLSDARDRAWVQAVVFGVCRHYFSLQSQLKSLLSSPAKLKDPAIEALLLVGLYQLKYMRTKDFAAVTETVNAAKKMGKQWASGLVNAVLRSYLRQEKTMTFSHDHPDWWQAKLKESWPKQYETIMTEDLKHPPMTLRVNLKKVTRDEYIRLCQSENISCVPCEFSKAGIRLQQPIPVTDLPGFAQGFVSVQDEAGQLAAELLDAKAGDRILDACSAPGSKFTHLLEYYDDIIVVGLEKSKERATLIQDNLSRLQLSATYQVGDVLNAEALFSDDYFDRILLDVPCSCSGVLRRHPDIKLLRKATDIEQLAQEQYQLLKSIWPALKPGGVLLYATCSVFKLENEGVISQFLPNTETAVHEKIDAAFGQECQYGRQILTGMHEMDGFYYAKLRKVTRR